MCDVSNGPGFFFRSACTSIPFGIQNALLLNMCACVCTRLCTSVCAHVYIWSSQSTPATTIVLCEFVRCYPFNNNLLPILPCVFMRSHSNSRQQEEKMIFGPRDITKSHYMAELLNICEIFTHSMLFTLICYYFRFFSFGGAPQEPFLWKNRMNKQSALPVPYCNSNMFLGSSFFVLRVNIWSQPYFLLLIISLMW